MMQRSILRRVTAYNLAGHADLTTDFRPRNFYLAPKPAKDQGVEVSVLPNGARVITHHKEGAHANVGIYAEAGAKFDPHTAPGLNYVMRWSLMTSNFDNSLFQIDRTLRANGAAFEHQEIRKRFIGFKIEANADAWRKPAENLFVGMVVPRFPEYDIERFRDTMDACLEEARWQRPRDYCVDVLETVAFHREALGNPRYVPEFVNDECSSEKLVDHWTQYCVPSRIVIAGVNVPHMELIALYESAPFQHSASAPHHAKAAPVPAVDLVAEEKQYQGGREASEQESREKHMGTKPHMEKETIAALGFRSFGRDLNVKQYAASLVLQQVIDMAFDDGIRYERHDSHLGVRSFYRPYGGTGMLGVTIRSSPYNITADIQAAAKSIRGLQIDKPTVEAAVQRAAVRFFHDELETNRDYIDHLASSLAPVGDKITKTEEILTAIAQTTPVEVSSAFALVRGDRPCLFATGEVLGMPSLAQMGL